jgi:hypothetical protein
LFPGEIVGEVKLATRKLFDDTIVDDSGISESSVTSENQKDTIDDPEPGPSGIRIKQERRSSTESFGSVTKSPKKSRKRKSSIDSDTFVTPIAKRIKAEPVSSDDEPELPQRVKQEKSIDSDSTETATKKKKKKSKDNSDSEPSSSKKSKKKKKKKRSDNDDFDNSLHLLLESAKVKKEK